jgi:hypothetical protein
VKISIILWARLKRHAMAWDIPSRSILAGVAMRRRGIPLEIGSSGLNAHTYTHKKWKQQQQILKFSHFQRFRSKEKLLKEKVHFICCKAQKKWMTRKLKPNRVIKACSLYPYIVFPCSFLWKEKQNDLCQSFLLCYLLRMFTNRARGGSRVAPRCDALWLWLI